MTEKESRRSFLRKSSAAVGATIAATRIPLHAHAQGSDLLKIGFALTDQDISFKIPG